MSDATADAAFEELAEELAGRGVVVSQMFGKRALKYESKAIGCLLGDALAFKLMAGTPQHAGALDLEGAALFDPSGKGRPMKDWVAVPVTHVDAWPGLALAALERLRGG